MAPHDPQAEEREKVKGEEAAVMDKPRSTPSLAPSEIQLQIERICASDYFRGSISLQRFLRYVAEKAIAGDQEDIKESLVAIEVFGRSADFDSRTDNVVRVQAHRLRNRLSEYYSGADDDDKIVIEIPKGHYVPRFVTRAPQSDREHHHAAWLTWRRIAPLLFLLGGVVGFYVHSLIPQDSRARDRSSAGELDGHVSRLWKPFIESGVTTIVSYTNPMFLATEGGDLVYYRGPYSGATGTWVSRTPEITDHINHSLLAPAGRLTFVADFSGVAEVQAVHLLSVMFTEAGADLRAKPSRALAVDELRNHNVVFLGSPFGNEHLAKVAVSHSYAFDPAWDTVDAGIRNHDPRPGEPPFYDVERDPSTGTNLADHGLLSVLPGLVPGKWLILLAGNISNGTLAAAQCATSPECLKEVTGLLGGELPPYFQAVVRAEIVKDQNTRIEAVAARKIPSQP